LLIYIIVVVVIFVAFCVTRYFGETYHQKWKSW